MALVFVHIIPYSATIPMSALGRKQTIRCGSAITGLGGLLPARSSHSLVLSDLISPNMKLNP
jgi:hypothetical protein